MRDFAVEVGVLRPAVGVDNLVFFVAGRVVLSNFLLMLIVVRDGPAKLVTCVVIFVVVGVVL